MSEQEARNAYSIVSTAPSLLAADMMVSYLQAHGVNARVKDVFSSGVASLSALPDGFRVEVQADQRDEASRLLKQHRNHQEDRKHK